jgi:hypothetical protein
MGRVAEFLNLAANLDTGIFICHLIETVKEKGEMLAQPQPLLKESWPQIQRRHPRCHVVLNIVNQVAHQNATTGSALTHIPSQYIKWYANWYGQITYQLQLSPRPLALAQAPTCKNVR